jgi:hypothetical protein
VLYTIPGDAMKTREGLYYVVKRPIVNADPAPVGIGHFAEDYTALRDRAELILL